MAKRKAQPVVMPKAESNTIKIHVDPWKVPIGHQPHVGGNGIHADKRKRRQRTRAAALKAALND